MTPIEQAQEGLLEIESAFSRLEAFLVVCRQAFIQVGSDTSENRISLPLIDLSDIQGLLVADVQARIDDANRRLVSLKRAENTTGTGRGIV